MIKIVTVVGARPQFVKAAVLSRIIQNESGIEEVLVHTGQHFDKNMSDVFFDDMEIPKPKYNLDIHGVGHGAMTGRMLEGIEEILEKEQPSMLLVYGDTNSTLAGALAAKKMHIPVGHVEAGLRSFNMAMPEEVNRILTDRISDILFCPTQSAIDNLKVEGYDNFTAKIVQSGDVMQDAALFYAQKSEEKSQVLSQLPEEFFLCTLHRAENTDSEERLTAFVNGLNQVHQEIAPVVLPLHPRTKAYLEKFNLDLKVNLIDPVGYFDMIELLKNCKLVLTDSGGLQKEAFFFQKSCLTLRDQTEWVELVNNGFNELVSPNDILTEKVSKTLEKQPDFSMNLYGEGKAGKEIIDSIVSFCKSK